MPPAGGGSPVEGETTAKIEAPASAKVGDEVDVSWETVKPASNNTDLMDIPQDSVQPTGWITVGGGGGELKVVGEKKNPPIPKKAPMRMSTMKGKLKLTKAGKITLTPGKYEVAVTFSFGTFVTKCAPTGSVGAGATIDVTAGSGSTSGGSTSGGSTSGAVRRAEAPPAAVRAAPPVAPPAPPAPPAVPPAVVRAVAAAVRPTSRASPWRSPSTAARSSPAASRPRSPSAPRRTAAPTT
ncbi:hypothetical protein ACFQFR_15300 [Streptomyces goshikiensis]